MFLARVAELADAPDLGLRNHRFQSVTSRFKTKPLHDRKTLNFREILHSTNTEQRTRHSSTNSSTRTHQSQAPARLTIGGGRRTSCCAPQPLPASEPARKRALVSSRTQLDKVLDVVVCQGNRFF